MVALDNKTMLSLDFQCALGISANTKLTVVRYHWKWKVFEDDLW